MENLEQRAAGGSSRAGKVLRIASYIVITALGSIAGYYAGQYVSAEKVTDAEQAAQKAEQRAKALETKLQEHEQLNRIKEHYEAELKKGPLPAAHKDP